MATARSKANLEELQVQHPQQLRIETGNATDPLLAKRVIDTAVKEFKQVDGLILNHGTMDATRISDANVEDWKHAFDVNFFSAITFVSLINLYPQNAHVNLSKVQLAIPLLRKSEGRIVFTSSGVVNHSYASWGAYCASKCALKSLGSTLALEEKNVITMSVAPGVVDTEMQQDIRNKHATIMDEKDSNRFITLHKEGKLFKPEQPGNVIARLVIDGPKELSGEMFR